LDDVIRPEHGIDISDRLSYEKKLYNKWWSTIL